MLLVGTAKPQQWAISIDVDPHAPADMICDGRDMPFGNETFDVVILDFVTNYMKPRHVKEVIREANRVGKRVMGRCHVSPDGHTLRGPKQGHCHTYPPDGVEWVEIREHSREHVWTAVEYAC